jgi:hypothetical protein
MFRAHRQPLRRPQRLSEEAQDSGYRRADLARVVAEASP